METLTIEYDSQNRAVKQIINGLFSAGISHQKNNENEFDRDLKRAISGEELMNRLSIRIHKMFENEQPINAKPPTILQNMEKICFILFTKPMQIQVGTYFFSKKKMSF